MNYKDTKIGFFAVLDQTEKKSDHKASIGFSAAIGKKGNDDPTHESSIGFTAKLPEREKPHPQMDLDF